MTERTVVATLAVEDGRPDALVSAINAMSAYRPPAHNDFRLTVNGEPIAAAALIQTGENAYDIDLTSKGE